MTPRSDASLFDRMKDKLGLRATPAEDDVAGDGHLAQTRATGGLDGGAGDTATTTGTGENEEFVGRVSGQDDGTERTSGAEARAFGTDDDAVADDEPSAGPARPDRR